MSSASHLFSYIQPIDLIQRKILEAIKAAIAESHAIKSVDILDKFFDLADIVCDADKLKKADYALRCENSSTLEGSKDESNAFDVFVE